MKGLLRFELVLLTVSVLVPAIPANSQVPAKKTLPQAPIMYPGDTDKTIARRAQWVEGAKKEGTMIWWGSDQPKEVNQMTAEFNKIYPFIKVDYWRGGEGERVSRIEAEHSIGRLTVDICDVGEPTNYVRWRKMALVDTYTEVIPGIEKMDKRMYSRHGDWAMLGNNAITPQYNTRLVPTAEAPKTWEDLLDPKWKGSIGLAPNMRPWFTLALGEGGWGVEKTEDFLRKLRQQQLIWVAGQSAGRSLMAAGEFKIMGANFLRYVFQSQGKGDPIGWSKATPIPITGGIFLLAKKAPHPNAARLFIEWMFSPPGLALYEKVTGYGAAHPGSGTMLSKTLEGLPLVYRTEEVLTKVTEMKLDKKLAEIVGATPE